MNTKHKPNCKMAFGHKDASCPRCQELLNGAEARTWNMSTNYQMTHGVGPEYQRFRKELKDHDCVKSKCGPVCTAFEG